MFLKHIKLKNGSIRCKAMAGKKYEQKRCKNKRARCSCYCTKHKEMLKRDFGITA